ncbi:MAG: hypothetical protein AB8B64_22565 [Granulosicoccus sp.]
MTSLHPAHTLRHLLHCQQKQGQPACPLPGFASKSVLVERTTEPMDKA